MTKDCASLNVLNFTIGLFGEWGSGKLKDIKIYIGDATAVLATFPNDSIQ